MGVVEDAPDDVRYDSQLLAHVSCCGSSEVVECPVTYSAEFVECGFWFAPCVVGLRILGQ